MTCLKCGDGEITVSKHCKMRWKVKCSKCGYNELMYYPQLFAYLQALTNFNLDLAKKSEELLKV